MQYELVRLTSLSFSGCIFNDRDAIALQPIYSNNFNTTWFPHHLPIAQHNAYGAWIASVLFPFSVFNDTQHRFDFLLILHSRVYQGNLCVLLVGFVTSRVEKFDTRNIQKNMGLSDEKISYFYLAPVFLLACHDFFLPDVP